MTHLEELEREVELLEKIISPKKELQNLCYQISSPFQPTSPAPSPTYQSYGRRYLVKVVQQLAFGGRTLCLK